MDDSRYEELRAVHASAIVLMRVLNEMIACLHLLQRGYVTQALSLTAGMLELAHVIGFIGADDARATKWFEHNNPARSYPGIKESIEATALSMGVPPDQTTREYEEIYREMCMAKHGKPIAMGQLGLTIGDGHVHLHLGPYVSGEVVQATRGTLGHVVRYTWLATTLFSKHHVSGDRAIAVHAQLRSIADAHAELTQTDLKRFRASKQAGDGE